MSVNYEPAPPAPRVQPEPPRMPHPLQNPKYQYLHPPRSSPPAASPPRVSSAPPSETSPAPQKSSIASPTSPATANTTVSPPPQPTERRSALSSRRRQSSDASPPQYTTRTSDATLHHPPTPYTFVALAPQLVHQKQPSSELGLSRPSLVHMPSHHGHVRGAPPQYIALPAHAAMQHVQVPTRNMTPFTTTTTVLPHPSGDRHRRGTVIPIAPNQAPVSRSQSVGHRRERSAASGGRSRAYVHSDDDSEDSETEFNSNMNSATNFPFGLRNAIPGVMNQLPPNMMPQSVAQPARPPMRARTGSQSTNATVHFNPDNLFLTFPSPHTLKLSNVPRFGSSTLLRSLKERVFTMWLPGMTYQKEGRGELIVGFAGLPEGAVYNGTGQEMLSEADRRNWGIWTARGQEGIAALRLLTQLMVTFAAQGLSYLSSLHSIPPQLIFSTTPEDRQSRFFCIELSVTPLPPKKTKVAVVSEDPEHEPITTKRKVKLDITRVGIRCVDAPSEVLKTLVGAVRNSGREGAGIYKTNSKDKSSNGSYYDDDEEDDERYPGGNELLEFGLQGERWEAQGVYHMESVISRGTGKRALSRKDISRARHEKGDASPLIEADTDQLPVLLSHLLKALSSHGYRLETSVPMPLPVPLYDPFSGYGNSSRSGGLSSFLGSCFGSSEDMNRTRGHGREVWMFRSVDWFQS